MSVSAAQWGWVGCEFQNQIFSFENVFSTQYGRMLHPSSGLNNAERAMWSCSALAAGPSDTISSTHTSSCWNILVERAVWKGDVAVVFQRFCQISHKSLQHENWPKIKNYTYITENNTH